MKKKVAILFGGCSSEYSVSLQSAAAVIAQINTQKYETILIGITKEGKWLLYDGDTDKIKDDTWYYDVSCIPALISPSRDVHGILEFHIDRIKETYVHMIFPVLHGKNGEDGTLQGLLELSGIPFAGCGSLSSALCMDKALAHTIAKESGVKIPDFFTVHQDEDSETIIKQTENMGYPLFVKPAKSGSSYGITKVWSPKQLIQSVSLAAKHDNKIIIEQTVEGFEVGCAILESEELIIGELDEIELNSDFFDYQEKYSLQTSVIHRPARISLEMTDKIKETAKLLFRVMECKGFARIDMFLTPKGDIVFNEINTIPGFTSHSRYPGMMAAADISFNQLIELIIDWELDK
ncbi:MAG: D-alanine--D-serine ligase VanG [Eubacteriales bacterium]